MTDFGALPRRIVSKIRVDELTGCWNWTGATIKGGYGKTFSGSKVDGTNKLGPVHRFSYELLVGPIPEGLQIDHLCRNRLCLNPAHLEPVTIRENVLRGVAYSAQNARKTHCLRGHPLSGDNLYTWHGSRACRTCARVRMAARYQAMKKAATL